MNMFDDLVTLADRPECEHGLNGPCRACGPSLTLAESIAWQEQFEALTDGTDRDTCGHCPASRDGCQARHAFTRQRCCRRCTHPTEETA